MTRSIRVRLLGGVVAGLLVAGCADPVPHSPYSSWLPVARVVHKPAVRFAVIGDYGRSGNAARDVARVVVGWRPDVVVTTGDNNYPRGEATTIDGNIGRHYHRFLAPYHGLFGAGALHNRFFPTLGNHDLRSKGGQPYFDYFTLPGNERYYDFVAGPVRFFALSSDPREPDGTEPWSRQGQWLRQRLAKSRAPWNVVYFHHPPFSSGRKHQAGRWMRWPFARWGADVVLAGHEHFYERLAVDGVSYFVVGLGGAGIYDLADEALPESRARFNGDYGALLGTADATALSLQFVTRSGRVVDRYVARRDPPGLPQEPALARIGRAPS